ncbi:MAG: hypothetical protein HZC43_06410 [Nitrosomonadales bacterium]|nr:hypothetical protein [Nitrosomonadales bacterium]
MYTNCKNNPYPFFNELPCSLKTLYTMVLLTMGMGYLFAMIQIYEVHSGRDGGGGLSVKDIQIAYSGSKDGSRLESALNGPMSSMLPADEKEKIVTWIHGGSDQKKYEETIKPLMETRCKACHDGSNPHLPNVMTYDGIKTTTAVDTGVSVSTLVRVSHIHLFGLTFIFFMVGKIFSHAYFAKRWQKCAVMATPFVAIFLDVGSWWVTKVSEPFAYVVIIGGALMGFSFAIQWVVSLYQMWIFKGPPAENVANG